MSVPMKTTKPPGTQTIRVNLLLPILVLGIGGVTVDPVEKVVGRPLSAILAPRMAGDKTTRPGKRKSQRVDVYPLAFHEGDSVLIPLGPLGEIGIRNDRGQLRLTVPLDAPKDFIDRLGALSASTPVLGWSSGSSPVRVQHLLLRVTPGMSASYSIGAMGEVGIEVPA